jgi:hypothetical protein
LEKSNQELRKLDRLDDVRSSIRELEKDGARASDLEEIAAEMRLLRERFVDLESRVKDLATHGIGGPALAPVLGAIEEVRRRIPPIAQTAGAVLAALLALGYAGFKLESLNKPVEAAAKGMNDSVGKIASSVTSLDSAKNQLQQVIDTSLGGIQPQLDGMAKQFETQSVYLKDLDAMMSKVANQAELAFLKLKDLELPKLKDLENTQQAGGNEQSEDPQALLLEMIAELGAANPYMSAFAAALKAKSEGRYSEARALAEQQYAKSQDVDEKVGLGLLVAESWELEAKFQEAIDQYGELLELAGPGDWTPKLLNGLAGSKMRLAVEGGSSDERRRELLRSASEDFQGAFELRPDNAPLVHNYALCLNELGSFERALEVIGSLQQIDDADVYYQKAVAHAGLMQSALAVGSLGEAIKRSRALALRAGADKAFIALRSDAGFGSLLESRLGPDLMKATRQSWDLAD